MEENEAYTEEYERNLSKSIFDLEETRLKLEIDTFYFMKCIDQLINICTEISEGIISSTTLEMIVKANKFDRAIDEAQKKGEFIGYTNCQTDIRNRTTINGKSDIFSRGNEKRIQHR